MKKCFKIYLVLFFALPALAQQTNVFPEDGKVGIGTTEPTENLDINGNIRIRNLQGTQNRYAIIGPDGVIRDGQLVEGPVKPGGGNNNNQGTSWSLNGNATNSSHFLGTTNNMPLIFRTNGSQKMVLTTDGKLGLGVTNPVQAFEVAGTIKADAIQVTGSAFSTYTNFHVTNRLKVGNSIWLFDDFQTPQGRRDIITSSTGRLVLSRADINNNGNPLIGFNQTLLVGIGTLHPQRNLHIKGFGCGNCVGLEPGTTYVRIEDELYADGGVLINTTAWDLGVSASASDGRFFIGRPNTSNFVTEALSILNNNNIGMGTILPKQKLHVHNGNILITGQTASLLFGNGEELPNVGWGNWGIEYDHPAKGLNFWKPYGGAGGHENYLLFLKDDGNVGIGTSEPYFKLDVCGTIRSKEWIVETGWCDFVFEEEYKRMTWQEKQFFIKQNKHLPEIASGKEIELNGLKTAETMRGMILNLEENTLDIIELYKVIEQQQKEINYLKAIINQK
jgi:hypothetical protein